MFNTTPPPRTHLYFCSRGLKYDEVLSVGVAPAAFVPSSDCVETSFAYCKKFFCSRNIFDVVPFTQLDAAPELPSADVIDKLKISSLYKFCNANGIYLNEKTNLLQKYETLKSAISDSVFNTYDELRAHFAELRAKYHIYDELTEEDIEAIFAAGMTEDIVADNAIVIQTAPAAVGSPPQLPEPVIQLSFLEDDVPCV